MIDIAQLRRIETLSHPNEGEPVEVPALELTDADYKAAHEAVHQLGSRLTVETILEAVASRHCRERQLSAALRSLAVTEADICDSHDIIKQWRAYYGFALDENGEFQYSPVPMN
jgi:hypothetical protein